MTSGASQTDAIDRSAGRRSDVPDPASPAAARDTAGSGWGGGDANRPSARGKVGLVLLSSPDDPVPSTRIAVLNMLPFFRDLGFEPVLLHAPSQGNERPTLDLDAERLVADDVRVVLFQKVAGPSVVATASRLRARGIRTVHVVCDGVDVEMARATDETVVVTEFLRSLYPVDVRDKVRVIHDGIEEPAVHRGDPRSTRGSGADPLRAVLVTSHSLVRLPVLARPPSWLQVTVVGRYTPRTPLQRLRDAQWILRQQRDPASVWDALRFMTSSRVRVVPWGQHTVYDELLAADIGILPIDTPAAMSKESFPPSWMIKSENRLTLMMAMALPVIATPIPSYEPVIVQGRTGFLARDREEWMCALDMLRDPARRAEIGGQARASVIERFSKVAQAERWASLLRELSPADGRRGAPRQVSVRPNL